jgi:hypothetical protein
MVLSFEKSPMIEEEDYKDEKIEFNSEEDDSHSLYELDTMNDSHNESAFKAVSRQIRDFKTYRNLEFKSPFHENSVGQ